LSRDCFALGLILIAGVQGIGDSPGEFFSGIEMRVDREDGRNRGRGRCHHNAVLGNNEFYLLFAQDSGRCRR